MKENMVKLLLLFLLVFGFAVNSLAQPPEDFDRPPTKEQMEKVRKRIETLRMWKLTRALDLDEGTSAKLFPLLNKYDKNRTEIEMALRNAMKDLRESLKQGHEGQSAKESVAGQLKNILDRLEENHRAMQRINDEERAELKKILTIEQQARFVLFQHEFEREIRKIIAEARERRFERRGKD